MDQTKFLEMLSEVIELEIEQVLKSSVRYKNNQANEIVVLLEDETKFRIFLEQL